MKPKRILDVRDYRSPLNPHDLRTKKKNLKQTPAIKVRGENRLAQKVRGKSTKER